jgi:hypothetical protein
MFTRTGEPSVDVDSFFWRQVVAQSPLSRKPGRRTTTAGAPPTASS